MDILKQELQFAEKKVKNLIEELKKTRTSYFDSLRDFAKDKNLLPKEWTDEWSMQFNEESGQVFTEKNEQTDHPLKALFESLNK